MGTSNDQYSPDNYLSRVNGNNSPSGSETPSRLSESTEGLRNALTSRNLYSEFNEYPLQPNTRQKIVNAIGSIVDTVLPFKSSNIADGVIGRLVSVPSTPLVDIGLIMLGKQFALNFQSNLVQETFPTINIKNAFDGNSDTKLFQKKIKYNITRKSEGGGLQNFIEDFFGYHPRRDSNSPTWNLRAPNTFFLENTGEGQLDFLFGSATSLDSGGLNRNIYKPVSNYVTKYDEIAEESGNKLIDFKTSLASRHFFSFSNTSDTTSVYDDFNIYYPLRISNAIRESEISANREFKINTVLAYGDTQIYAPNSAFVSANMGTAVKDTKNFNPLNNDGLVSETGINENINDRLVWGRDGVLDGANGRLASLRGVDNITQQDPSKFRIKTGLLAYTQQLLNATEGQVVDQTRKIFENRRGFQGMNGSSLWSSNDSDYANKSGIGDKVGVRQHSVLDQYDRFAKAIRFNGNAYYNGNPNSVINKSVLPRINPTIDKDQKGNSNINNENLMFSLENLAVTVNGDENTAIIDDEFGTQIPLSEKGPSGGRYMWFPPYAISINEVAKANYDSTVMVGRNEPIYSYMHSERSATLSFMLIIDYPEQVRNYMKDGIDAHKNIAEFFAFGGDSLNVPKPPPVTTTTTTLPIKPTEIIIPDPVRVYFPNDYPTQGDDGGAHVIDNMYQGLYEVEKNLVENVNNLIPKNNSNKSFGLNGDGLYYFEGVNKSTNVADIPTDFKQSEVDFVEGSTDLDDALYNAFSDEENAKYIKIELIGSATKLYTPGIDNDLDKGSAYNLDLSERRINSVKEFISKRLTKILGKSADNLGINFDEIPLGDKNSLEENNTAESVNSKSAKEERYVEINFTRNEVSREAPQKTLTSQEIADNEQTSKERQNDQSTANSARRNGDEFIMNERESAVGSDEDHGILKGFKSLINNQFYPAFHSQTPEDFHKRLTFLQQCTRQGSAIKSAPDIDVNGTQRVKNSVFGKQPICVLRVGDFFNTKVIIESVTVDYDDTTWDMNPEGFGMQPMIANITLQMHLIGGQSLKGPIDALQNAVSFNYYANSTYSKRSSINAAASYTEALEYGLDSSDLNNRISSQQQFRDGLEDKNKKSNE